MNLSMILTAYWISSQVSSAQLFWTDG